ncbi:MAG: hypothetical protein QM820_06350 [Minicystis sp.]
MRLSPIIAAAILTLGPAGALAHGGGSTMPAEVPQAPPGDGATAQGILRDLEAKAAKDADTAKVVAEPIKNAKRALERAHGARTAGDEPHAKMLDGLALTWAEAARDLDRAAAAERVATAAAQKANEVMTKAERARALLEETQARRGRAAAELAKVEADAKEAAKSAGDAEAQRLEAAKKKGAKAVPAAAPKGAAKGKAAGGKGGK